MPAFPSGTRKIFKMASAPSGWTKDSATFNHALRIVTTSTFGSGGSVNFTDLFNPSRPVTNVTFPGVAATLTVSPGVMDIPAHTHTFTGYSGTATPSPNSGYPYTAGPTAVATITGWSNPVGARVSGASGGGGTHTHTLSDTLTVTFGSASPIDMSVKYVDSIICIKD